jgi:hypothetical protein
MLPMVGTAAGAPLPHPTKLADRWIASLTLAMTGSVMRWRITSASLTIFWRCGWARLSFRTKRKAVFGNQLSTVSTDDLPSHERDQQKWYPVLRPIAL